MTATPSERINRESKAEQEILAGTKRDLESLAKRRKTFKPQAPPVPVSRPKRTPDYKLTASSRVVDALAEQIHRVRDHVQSELASIGSLPDHTPLASEAVGKPRKPMEGKCVDLVSLGDDVWHVCGLNRPCAEHDAPVRLTAVERAAEQRLQLGLDLADYEALCALIITATSDAHRSGERLLGLRLEQPERSEEKVVMKCCDGQVGKAGAFEWGEPTCELEGIKADMCIREYWRWYRYRKANDQKTPEVEDAA